MAEAIACRSDDPDGIHLKGVSYAYPSGSGQTVLRGIDLDVRPGEYLLICGPSGSGKSTLVRTFNGLIPHFYGGRLSGRVQIAGRPSAASSVADLFDRVGLVFQNPRAQLFNRTVTQELAFGLESLGLPRPQMKARVQAVAAELDMQNLLNRNPQDLSGGEQQLVALASVLTLQPHIVVLDEPLANLDAHHVRRLRHLLGLLRSRGTGVVVCEHRLTPTLPDADRLVLVHQGAKKRDGLPRKILDDPLWRLCGVDLPLAVRIGIAQQVAPLPLDMPALLTSPAVLKMDKDSRRQLQEPSRTGAAVLAAENVSFSKGRTQLLNRVDLKLHAGRCTALVGANGAGKTTLLRLLCGLLRPASGRILLGGKNLASLAPWEIARQMGVAFQNPNSQFFKLTVREEILVGPKALNRMDADWFDQLVALFKLEDLLDRAPFKLSGGEKKRVAFAAALAAKPAVLALDEPTAGQDGLFRKALAQVLGHMKQQGAAVLVVTHALNFAQQLSNHWVVMAKGRVLEQGRPEKIMADSMLMQQAGLAPTEKFLWRQACKG